MRALPALFLLVGTTWASYCGQAAVPFSFQNLKSGQPVLGCARPRCFGWNTNGTRASDNARFYRINGKEDGYIRRSDLVLRRPSRNPNFVPQTSNCDQSYTSSGCSAGQWLGGISPQADVEHNPLQVGCCSYAALNDVEERGTAVVKQGQLFIGGEVTENNVLVAFDYVADVSKEVFGNGTVTYNVVVRRMKCTDDLDAAPISSNDLQNLNGDITHIPQQVPQPSPPQQRPAPRAPVQSFPPPPPPPPQGAPAPPYVGLPFQQTFQPRSLNGAGYPPQFSQQVPPQALATAPPTAPPPPPGAFPTLPTLPPLMKLEDFSTIEIPSVENVEAVIPPMHKAILTNIAKFFGVL